MQLAPRLYSQASKVQQLGNVLNGNFATICLPVGKTGADSTGYQLLVWHSYLPIEKENTTYAL